MPCRLNKPHLTPYISIITFYIKSYQIELNCALSCISFLLQVVLNKEEPSPTRRLDIKSQFRLFLTTDCRRF